MLLALFIIFVALIIAIVWMIRWHDIAEPCGMFFSVVAVVAILVLLFTVWSDNIPIDKCNIMTERIPIVALQDNLQTEGRFVLGTGAVSNAMHYYYMLQTNSGLLMKDIEAKKVYIVETDDIGPCIETIYSTGFKQWYDYILNIPGLALKTTMYVPTNTVYRNYNINMR